MTSLGRTELPLALFITSGVVLAANSNQLQVVTVTSNLRFAMYALLVAIALASRHLARGLPMGISMPLLGITLLSLGSVLWSISPSLTLQRGVGMALLLAACALLSHRAFRDQPSLEHAFGAITLVSVSVLLVGLALFLSGAPIAYDGGAIQLNRLTGLLVSSNSVGVLVALLLPVMVALRRASGSGSVRFFYAGAITVAGASLALSQSRGGIVAGAIGLSVYILLDRTRRPGKLALVCPILVIALSALFVVVPQIEPGVVSSLRSRFASAQPKSEGGSGRLVAWGLAVDVWSQSPVAGWGFGTAEVVFGPRSKEIEQVFQGHNPHNSYLNTLIELGPVGALFLGAAVAFTAKRFSRRGRDPLLAGFGGSIWAGVTVSMFESGLTSPGSVFAFLFWLVVFSAIRLEDLQSDEGRSHSPLLGQGVWGSVAQSRSSER